MKKTTLILLLSGIFLFVTGTICAVVATNIIFRDGIRTIGWMINDGHIVEHENGLRVYFDEDTDWDFENEDAEIRINLPFLRVEVGDEGVTVDLPGIKTKVNDDGVMVDLPGIKTEVKNDKK